MSAIVMASIFAFSPFAFAPQAKDPEDVLTTYLGDLEKAVKNTTSKNLADRAKLETSTLSTGSSRSPHRTLTPSHTGDVASLVSR